MKESAPNRWRFSLATIVFVMTLACLALGLFRALPANEEARHVCWWVAGMSGIATLVAIGPTLLRVAELRRRFDKRDSDLRAWSEEKRAAHRGGLESPAKE
jgi:hypothetical protein